MTGTDLEFVQLLRIQNTVLVGIAQLEYSPKSGYTFFLQNLCSGTLNMREFGGDQQNIRGRVSHTKEPWDGSQLSAPGK